MPIREAEADDLEKVISLEHQYADQRPEIASSLFLALRAESIEFLVYDAGGPGVVGHCIVDVDGRLHTYVVHPSFRGGGRAVEMLKECGADHAYVRVENEASQGALESAGFERAGKEQRGPYEVYKYER